MLKPQNEWISENGKLDSEVLLGKFEELDVFIKEICEKKNSLGSYQNFKNYNMNKSIGRKNYKDEYTEETKRMVNEMYKKDIEIFNYDF